MSKQITVSEKSYKELQAALVLTGQDEQEVLSELISQYARKIFEYFISEKSSEDSAVEEQPVGNSVSEYEQKQLFMKWFKGLTRNGKLYNPVTISGYTGRIENACNDPVFADVPVTNLFKITDLEQFIDIKNQIKSCDGYVEFDAKSHNGFTAALRKYEEFLRFQASGSSARSAQPASELHYKPSNVHRWTMEEDETCCRRFLDIYVVKQSNLDIARFLQMLAKEVPNVSEGSLRMKIQNIKYLAMKAGLKDTATIKWLSQYSMQCERAFKKALNDFKL